MELLKTSCRTEVYTTAYSPPGYWGEWWEKQQNPQGSQWNNCGPWCHQVSRRHFHNHNLIGRVARRKPFLTTRHRRKCLELPNIINIMTGTRCSGQMRPKLKVFVRYSIGMFGVGTEMHTRRSTSYPQWNMVVGQSCLGAVFQRSRGTA